MGYSPRKRARSQTARFTSWPEYEGEPKIQGFAGYKAGMTHIFMIDYRKTSDTSGQEVAEPVTVIEVPPVKVASVRAYQMAPYGLQVMTEVWADNLSRDLERKIDTPNKKKKPDWSRFTDDIDDIRVIIQTQPGLVTGVPKKKPELLECRIGGGTMAERIEYSKKILGKELKVQDFVDEGKMVDVVAVTKGKGFQGHVKRWGVKLLTHKNSKHRRMIGNLGPFSPGYVKPTVRQAGQMGYHKRTEHNKRIVKMGEKGEEINPKGGFLHYGLVRNPYILIHGSVPGPVKRLISLRDPARSRHEAVAPEISYISRESKQGV
jgi:large subunit ribosomal protein L3